MNSIHVSRSVECQLRWQTFRMTKHQQNDRKCWRNSGIHPQRPSPNSPCACRHHWDQLWSLPGDLSRKFEHVPHCSFITTMCPPTHPWKPQSLWLTTAWLSFPILLARLSPLWFRFVSQIENDTEGMMFWNIDIQGESRADGSQNWVN
jgi:hypothetical protein